VETNIIFGSKFNQQRRLMSYRIGKTGTGAFLLFDRVELTELYQIIGEAIGACDR